MNLKRIISRQLGKLSPIKYCRNQGMQIGEGCRFIALPDIGTEPYLIKIGNHVNVCGDVTFLTHDGGTWVFRDNPEYEHVIKYGKITIEDNCFVGKGSIIMPGVTIHKNSVIGAGSIVTKDVPPGKVVAGIPAKIICTVEEYAQKCKINTPNYDKTEYLKNKKNELIRLYMDNK